MPSPGRLSTRKVVTSLPEPEQGGEVVLEHLGLLSSVVRSVLAAAGWTIIRP